MRGIALLLAFLLGCSATTSTPDEQVAGASESGNEGGLVERDRQVPTTQESSGIQRPPTSEAGQQQVPESIDKGMMFDALKRDLQPMRRR